MASTKAIAYKVEEEFLGGKRRDPVPEKGIKRLVVLTVFS
jgi:hypothetical protein